jgi:copper chaperone NosL
MIRITFLLLMAVLISACNEQQTGPAEVKWDRDSCARCQMMLSERNYSAQVRVFPEGKRSKVYKFDDLGCAVLWLDTQTYKDDLKTEIWVNDYKTREWINAREAWYIKGEISPMGYGLGAQTQAADGALNYVDAIKHIYLVEKKFNIHGGNLDH